MWKVLIPYDGSSHAQAALEHVIALAHKGLALHAVLVNVQAPPTLVEAVRLHNTDRLTELRTAAGADLLAPAEAALDAAGVRWESEVIGGDALQVLPDAVATSGCQAVACGARGMGDADRSGIGSVATTLVERAGVPVTLVRAGSS